MSDHEKLFEEFPPVSTQKWMDKITADLKGADFHNKLVWKTREGFEVMPFYRREDIQNLPHTTSLLGEFPWVRGTKTDSNNWLIRQNIDVENYLESNKKALFLLDRGVESLGFKIKYPDTITYENISTLLENISPEKAEINFNSEGKAKEIVKIILKLLEERNIEPALLRGAFESDTLGRLMVNGKLCTTIDEGFSYVTDLFKIAAPLKSFRLIQVNASFFSDAGADVVTELAYGLAMGNEYMAALTDRGISSDTAASRIRFSFGIGSNYFFEIAKLRAARMLWALIVSKYQPDNLASTGIEIHCVTSRWNKTIYDPYVNMLRTQTEAMAATLGGCNSLTVEPFDAVFQSPGEFSERIARNQQLIMREEAYFGKVADPAGGSYYVESLTNLIAEHAWKIFTGTEAHGGFLKALYNGSVQKRVKECAGKRFKDISSGKEVFTGTTIYPDFKETISREIDTEALYRKPLKENGYEVEPLPVHRGAEEIEKLRLVADSSECRPSVFMLPVGNLAMAMARSQFSCNFFACGGYRIIDNPLFRNIDDGIGSALKSGAEIIVLCSSDEEYAVLGPELYNKLEGKAIPVIAGNPPCMEELRNKGLKYFISIRSDLVETLSMFHRLTGLIVE